MNINDFSSANRYIILPSKSRPRVYLPIDTKSISDNAFCLYQPFSLKGKMVKSFARIIFHNFNALAKRIFPTYSLTKSEFLSVLEDELKVPLKSAMYLATDKNKMVLQLQTGNDILGYLKYALNTQGVRQIKTEINALRLLAKDKIVPSPLLTGEFEGRPYILSPNLQGQIKILSKEKYDTVLNRMKREHKFALDQHPRILSLLHRLRDQGLAVHAARLENLCSLSKHNYFEVFEHGDFAPWNLVDHWNEIIPFDLENFVEHGIEHFDEIKYHFQINHLLRHKKGKKLISAIRNKMPIQEFDIIFQAYLIKEISENYDIGKPYQLEAELLENI